MRFQIPDAAWCLEFPKEAVLQLQAFSQKGGQSRELVGQLYTRDLQALSVQVDHVTLIAPLWARFTSVRLDMKAVRRERDRLFVQGFTASASGIRIPSLSHIFRRLTLPWLRNRHELENQITRGWYS